MVEDLPERMTRRLLEACSRKIARVILYGSRARGEARADSDVDLLVVYRGSINRPQARRLFRDALRELRPQADLHVVTEEQFEAGKNVVGCLAEAAHRRGKVLHPREERAHDGEAGQKEDG